MLTRSSAAHLTLIGIMPLIAQWRHFSVRSRAVAVVCVLVLMLVSGIQTMHVCGELIGSTSSAPQLRTSAHAEAHCFLCHVPHTGRASLVLLWSSLPSIAPVAVATAVDDGKDIEFPFPLFVRPPPAA
jgi:hypothetical protein